MPGPRSIGSVFNAFYTAANRTANTPCPTGGAAPCNADPGCSEAVFIDATLVRMVLVPATTELLGDANWWFPGWLDRIVPSLGVEVTCDEPVAPGLVAEPIIGDAT